MAIKYLILTTLVCLINCDELKQVVVLSRHNIRSPLSASLQDYTPREWLKWADEPGHLTTKGALLEEYLGEYFAEWLVKEKLLNENCPNDATVLVYANTLHRTEKTGEHFAKRAFKSCNVTVQYREGVERDPLFHPVILNNTEEFLDIARNEIQEKLDVLNLKVVYKRLNNILDIKNSRICEKSGICDLVTDKDKIVLELGEEPDLFGPLKVGNEVADAFLMAYYNGEDIKNIGWGEINDEDWEELAKLTVQNQIVRFKGTEIAKHVSRLLTEYIKQEFLEKRHKFTFLVGHDSNINSVLEAIGVKTFKLDDQNELSPIGGKVVFEKWFDGTETYIKVNYIYLSTLQIRSGLRISEENPPLIKRLELKDCTVNKKGYCLFKDFIKILDRSHK